MPSALSVLWSQTIIYKLVSQPVTPPKEGGSAAGITTPIRGRRGTSDRFQDLNPIDSDPVTDPLPGPTPRCVTSENAP